MNIIEFLNKHDIKWCPVELSMPSKKPTFFKKIGKSGIQIPSNKRDDPYFMFDDLNKIYKTIQNEQNDTEFIWIDTNKVSHLDIDGETDFKIEAPYFKSITKQFPHYFISKTSLTTKTRHGTSLSDGCPIDLLRGQSSYCRRDAIVSNADLPIKNHDKILANETNPRKIPNFNQIKEQFLLTHEGWIKDTGLWKKYGSLWKSLCPEEYEEFDKISRGEYSKKRTIPQLYNNVKNKELFEDFQVLPKAEAYEKLKNLISKTPKLKKSFKNLETGETETTVADFSKMICDYYNNEIFAYSTCVFIKQKNGLFYEPSMDKNYFKSVLRRDILMEYSYTPDCPADMVDAIQNYTRINLFVDALLDELYKRGREINPNMKTDMNSNYNYIGFDNGVLRLTDMTFSKTGFENTYLSWSVGYDYPEYEPTKEQLEVFDKWLNSYGKSGDGKRDITKDTITMIVETICDKNSHERAFFLMGTGGNGKSVLCSIISQLLGSYSMTVPFDSLTKGLEADGKRPDIKPMRNKRAILVGEGDEKDKIHSGLFKTLATDKDEILCRDLHETRQSQTPFYGTGKLIISHNFTKMNFTSAVCPAIKRRILCQEAPNTFIDSKITNIPKNELPRDYELIASLLLNIPYMWFWLKPHILNYYSTGLPPYSEDFMTTTKEFIKGCDKELNLFLDEVEEDPNERVSLNEVWNLVQAKHRDINKNNFWKSIRANFSSAGKFDEGTKRLSGKKVRYTDIIGYRLPSNDAGYILDDEF